MAVVLLLQHSSFFRKAVYTGAMIQVFPPSFHSSANGFYSPYFFCSSAKQYFLLSDRSAINKHNNSSDIPVNIF